MKKVFLGACAIFTVASCSNLQSRSEPIEYWKNFGNKPSLSSISQPLGENQSLVLFYRQNDIQGPAVNIYINGDYQSSLLANAFTPIAVCSAKNLFSSSFSTNVGFGNRSEGVYYTLPINETVYVKVIQDSNGKLDFIRVEKSLAEQDIFQLPKQSQTLSRVPAPKNCGTPVIANKELDANALFKFNKSSYQDIYPKGRQDIEEFAQRILSFSGITKIVVSGHTDPSGSEAYNKVLSQKRAETVKSALQKSGISLPIEAIGYGQSQPVVSHCDSLKGKAKQECNLPNRRVEITVYGNQ